MPKPPPLSPRTFAKALSDYCSRALAEVEKTHGKPSRFKVTWSDAGPFWCRAFNLGWTAAVQGTWHTKNWLDTLEVDELDRAPFRQLAARHPQMKAFFREDGRDALKGDWESPGGEYGRWLAAVYDATIAEVAGKLKRDARFEGLDFTIEGHDGDGPHSADHYAREVESLRDAKNYTPSPEFLKGFFETLLGDDEAAVTQWTAFALSLGREAPTGLGNEYCFFVGRTNFHLKTLPPVIESIKLELLSGQPALTKVPADTQVVVGSSYEHRHLRNVVFWNDPKIQASADGGLLVSKAFKALLEQACTATIEYAPVSLIHAYMEEPPRPVKTKWFLANVVSCVDCIDKQKSKLGEYGRQILVLDPDRLDPKLNLFRLADCPHVYVVRQDLRAVLEQTKGKDFGFLPLDVKQQARYWGPLDL